MPALLLPRVYPILDTATLPIPLEEAARALIGAGTGILQIRHKGHWPRGLFEAAARIREQCRAADAVFVINDRADMAALLDAALHVGQDDLPPEDARRLIGADRLLGFSTHNDAQLRAAASEPADYLALGPIFATSSKEKPDPVVGVDRLRQWRALTPRPLVAIGGITRRTARAVLEAGADSLAVISDLIPESPEPRALAERMKEWLQLTK